MIPLKAILLVIVGLVCAGQGVWTLLHPQARLAIFEHCGHMAPVEAPAAVSDALRDWLQAA